MKCQSHFFSRAKLNKPSSQETSILNRPLGLKLGSIKLITKVCLADAGEEAVDNLYSSNIQTESEDCHRRFPPV